MRASDAGIMAVVQRVVREIVFADVLPDSVVSPVCQGIDLQQVKLFIPLYFAGAGTSGSLIATDGRSPRPQPSQLLS